MTKEQRTKQIIVRVAVTTSLISGAICGTAEYLIGAGKLHMPEPKQECAWEACDCIDSFGRPLLKGYHCSIHEHTCLD